MNNADSKRNKCLILESAIIFNLYIQEFEKFNLKIS